MDDLSLVDLGILLLFGVAALRGLFTGLIAGVMRIGVIVAAVLCTFWYGSLAGELLAGVFPERWMATLAGYLGSFFGVLITGGLLTQLLRRVVRSAGLGGLDRVGGLLFGLVGAYLALVVVFYVLAHTPFKDSDLSDQSRLAHMFDEGGRWLAARFGEQVDQAGPILEEGLEIPGELPRLEDLPADGADWFGEGLEIPGGFPRLEDLPADDADWFGEGIEIPEGLPRLEDLPMDDMDWFTE